MTAKRRACQSQVRCRASCAAGNTAANRNESQRTPASRPPRSSWSRRLPIFGLMLFALTLAFPDVTDLQVTKSGNNVVLSWTTGTPNFRVLRSRTPSFMSGNVTVAEALAGSPSTDVGAAGTAELYFYQVVGAEDPSPGLFDLNPPRLVPTITMLTPDSGQPGISVTIDGTGFVSDGSGTVVMFGDLAAEFLSATSTQIIVTVPTGAVTSDVVVCVVDVCSNRMRFTVTVGPTFQNISSLAFEPGTGSLWVGDRGAGSVVEIDSAGTSFNRAALAMAFVSNPSPGDGTGRIYFANGSDSNNNLGSIRYIDSSDNSNVFFRAAGTAMTDPVGARGLAARDSEPNVAYILDLNDNTVRRVPGTLAIDSNWGNTDVLLFNDPAGARFDSAGNLYVSSTTAIYRIAPNEAVTQVATGFTGAAGIDLSEDTGIPTLLVADSSTGQVFLVNALNGTKEVVGDGFTNPVAVAFSRNVTTGDLFYDVAEPTRIIRLADPRVRLALRDPTPVLIHKYRPEDQYPSTFQTENRKITVELMVLDAARPAAGVTVYFRPIDLPDTSPYSTTGVDDNKGGPGTVIPDHATSDAQGKVRTVLTITDTYSGDNYQVEASLQAAPNFKKVARSGVFTAWKRAHVEYDRMYKVGEFVDQTSGAGQADPAQVFVVNPATFTVGEEVHVLSGTPSTQEGERRTVSAVAIDHIVVNSALASTYTYIGPAAPGDAAPYSFVAKVSGGVYEVLPTSNTLAISFTDPFLEWKFVDGGSFLPAWPVVGDPNVINTRTPSFFKNVLPGTVPKINHVQLVAAGALGAPDPNIRGVTQAENDGILISKNWSWIFTDTIQSSCIACTGLQIQNSISDVTAHELAHQWNVNLEIPDTGGHDMQNTWNDATKKCLMNQARDRKIGPARLHENLAAPTNDLYCIRGHTDDLNQDSCTWPP